MHIYLTGDTKTIVTTSMQHVTVILRRYVVSCGWNSQISWWLHI